MKKSNILALSTILASLLLITVIGFLGSRLIRQNVPLAEFLMKDYYNYQITLMYTFPLLGYICRYYIYHGFYKLITSQYPETSCVLYHHKPQKKYNLAYYKENDNVAMYYFGIPFIPVFGKNICFNNYLLSNSNNITNYFYSINNQQLNKVNVTLNTISLNINKHVINISWKYSFQTPRYERDLYAKTQYYFIPDILSYDLFLSKVYCNASKFFKFYKVRSPKDFITKYNKLKTLCKHLTITGRYINCTLDIHEYNPYYVSYNISPYFNFSLNLIYWCKQFGGALISGDCKLPKNAKGETYYYECFNDTYTKQVSNSGSINDLVYKYTFYVFRKELPNTDNPTTIYYPITEHNLTVYNISSQINTTKINERNFIFNKLKIMPNLVSELTKYFVYYGKKYIYDKYICEIGYTTIKKCVSNPYTIINSSDGFYIKDATITGCCEYTTCGNSTCCDKWMVSYKRRVKYLKHEENAFTLITFGCFQN